MRILRNLFLILILLLVIGAVVLATLPAEYAYRMVADRLGVVRLSGISGTIWQGHAAGVTAFNQPLGALDWRLEAAPLLGRRVLAHLRLSGGEVNADGTLDRDADGVIMLRQTQFSFPASLAEPALDIPSLHFVGRIDGTLVQARVKGLWVDQASGTLQWKDATVGGEAQANLGDLQATFASAPDGSIAGVAHDSGGPMQLNGTFTVRAGSFEADAILSAREGNPQVAEALHFIGQPQTDGSSHLIVHGQLFKLF